MSYSIQCVHCQAVLKSPKPVPAGKTVKCPKCERPFKVAPSPDDEDAMESAQTAVTPKPPRAAKPPPPPIEEVDVDEADDDEDEKSRSKRKREEDDDDDEDEKPRSKRKRDKDDDEDDDDEKPRSKRKRDEDDDEKPRSKRKRDNDDNDDDDDREASRKKKAKKGSPMMLLGIIGGGVLVLLLCVVCGVGGYFLVGNLTGPDIVGNWENNDIIKMRYEFRADGTGRINAIVQVDFRYRQEGNRVFIRPTGLANIGGMKIDGGAESAFTARREGDTLIMHDDRKGAEIRLRKVP